MKLTKGDIVLVVFLAIFSVFFAFFMANVDEDVANKYVSIQVNGKEINKIPLTDDMIGEIVEIETEYGTNVIEFSDGELKIIDASCLDKLCIKQGAISQVGQLLVCLPNRLVVEIRSDDTTTPNEIDNMAF